MALVVTMREGHTVRSINLSNMRIEIKDYSNDTYDIINLIIGGFSEDYPTLRAAKDKFHTLLKGPSKSTTGNPVMKFDATIKISR